MMELGLGGPQRGQVKSKQMHRANHGVRRRWGGVGSQVRGLS